MICPLCNDFIKFECCKCDIAILNNYNNIYGFFFGHWLNNKYYVFTVFLDTNIIEISMENPENFSLNTFYHLIYNNQSPQYLKNLLPTILTFL